MPTTANMVALTASALMVLYPRLSFKAECLVVEGHSIKTLEHQESEQLERHSYDSNAHWMAPCGVYCPERIRKTMDDPGIACYSWSPKRATEQALDASSQFSTEVSETDVLGSLTWTIGACSNVNCQSSSLRDARAEILRYRML